MLHRPISIGESNVREHYARYLYGRGCIDRHFIINACNVPYSQRSRSIVIFSTLKASLNQTASVIQCRKLVNLLRALNSHTCGGVRTSSRLSSSIETTIGVQQRWPISPLMFNFVVDEPMKHGLGLLDVDIVLPIGKLRNRDYADKTMLVRACEACAEYTRQTRDGCSSIWQVHCTLKAQSAQRLDDNSLELCTR